MSRRANAKQLSQASRRIAIGLESGVDIKKIFAREAGDRITSAMGRQMAAISAEIEHHQTLADSMKFTGNYFPQLFRDMVAVGEETGQLPEVMHRLSEYYEFRHRLKQQFKKAIAWPMMQLVAAIAIVGLIIWVMGILPKQENGKDSDLLGFGLTGTKGLFKYCLFIATLGLAAWFVIFHLSRGSLWTAPIQRLFSKIPVIGGALAKIAVARICWTLNLTFNTGMDAMRAIRLAMQASANAYFQQFTEKMVQRTKRGDDLFTVFNSTGVFPSQFLDALEVGEHSGRLTETMGKLSEIYQQEAASAFETLTMIAAKLVWFCVAGLLIFLILRIAMTYVNMLNSFM